MMIIFELEVVDVDSDLKVLGNFLNIVFLIVLMGDVVLFMFIVIVIVIIAKNVPGITANVSLCISFCTVTVTVTVTIHG